MDKPVRLLDEGADELERALLTAARREAPPDPSARARTLAALASASGATAVVGASAVISRWWRRFEGAVTRLPVTGAIAAVVALGGSLLLAHGGTRPTSSVRWKDGPRESPAAQVAPSSAPSPPATRVFRVPDRRGDCPIPTASAVPSPPSSVGFLRSAGPPPRVEPPASAVRPVPWETSSHAGRRLGDPPVLPIEGWTRLPEAPLDQAPTTAAPVGTTAPAVTAASTSTVTSSLRDEADLLEGARHALAASRADRALDLLHLYEGRFASGALADEATVLKVEALLAAGRRQDARQVSEDFARRHPQTSYTRRLRALVEKE